MVQRAFVNFKDYNGYKDVKFVMCEKDIEWRRSLTKGEFAHKDVLYVVHSDWSVSPKK